MMPGIIFEKYTKLQRLKKAITLNTKKLKAQKMGRPQALNTQKDEDR